MIKNDSVFREHKNNVSKHQEKTLMLVVNKIISELSSKYPSFKFEFRKKNVFV